MLYTFHTSVCSSEKWHKVFNRWMLPTTVQEACTYIQIWVTMSYDWLISKLLWLSINFCFLFFCTLNFPPCIYIIGSQIWIQVFSLFSSFSLVDSVHFSRNRFKNSLDISIQTAMWYWLIFYWGLYDRFYYMIGLPRGL